MAMIRVLLVVFGCVVLIAMWCIIETQKQVIIRVPDPNSIPSAKEIQQRLNDLNDPRYFCGKPDGIIGKQSQMAWDNYIIDRFAIATFKPEYYEGR